MDRLETIMQQVLQLQFVEFTFQYGQIRNIRLSCNCLISVIFTFQYGQIRNKEYQRTLIHIKRIYIPVWIDQKHIIFFHIRLYRQHLHSSMDRLETSDLLADPDIALTFTFQYGQIRNFYTIIIHIVLITHLHSSMDRLETKIKHLCYQNL